MWWEIIKNAISYTYTIILYYYTQYLIIIFLYTSATHFGSDLRLHEVPDPSVWLDDQPLAVLPHILVPVVQQGYDCLEQRGYLDHLGAEASENLRQVHDDSGNNLGVFLRQATDEALHDLLVGLDLAVHQHYLRSTLIGKKGRVAECSAREGVV